ncbi:hypothetical protein [Tissierella creatinophila]|uniref:Uncharacterized protein n=1 Tax=Tissierella creatinophila DSM 6911 TaxID=1123403 RepID=A0A1U7M6B1_TISCR|nr:hypothetical protein [Tissierella creatinophila]OLS02864.1 hypothetical protein TICRE_11370 [Tissierella creatinophila DSM 6911]
MRTLNKKKRSFYIMCIIVFIAMITISLGLTKEKPIEKKEIKRATFVKHIKKEKIYLE